MPKYDYSRLIGRMREKGYTQEKMARALGISETSLNHRLNNRLSFRQDEIASASNILSIPMQQIEEYFFAKHL